MTTNRSYVVQVIPQSGYIDVPAHDVQHPSVTMYSQGFESFTSQTANPDGWTPGNFPTGANVYGSTFGSQAAHTGVGAMSVAFGSASTVANTLYKVSRTVTGLTVGRTYTFSAWFVPSVNGRVQMEASYSTSSGTAGAATDVTAGTPANLILTGAYIADGTSTVVTMSVSTSATQTGVLGYWDDVTFTQDAWTEHVADHYSSGVFQLFPVDGSITLDETVLPYGQMDLTVSIPDQRQLAALDPRLRTQVIVTVYERDVVTSVLKSRDFAFWLQDRVVSHNDGTVQLTLATEDARLNTFMRVASTDDSSYLTLQTSVRSIVSTVLINCGIATSLAPGPDADFTTLDSRTNLVTNGSFEYGTTGWTAGTSTLTNPTDIVAGQWPLFGTHSLFIAPSSTSSNDSFAQISLTDVNPGGTISVSGYIHPIGAMAGSLNARARSLVLIGSVSGTDAVIAQSSAAPNTSNVTRLFLDYSVPANVSNVRLRLYNGALASQVNNKVYWDGVMVTVGNGMETDGVNRLGYFDGDFVDTAYYGYAYTGVPGSSESTRTPVFDRSPDTLHWQPGETAWDFLGPILSSVGLRLFADESYTWRLVDNTYQPSGLLTVTPTLNLYQATDEIGYGLTGVDGSPLFFDSAVVKYSWTDQDGNAQTAYDTYSAPGATGNGYLVEYDRPYPGPGAAKYWVNRALNRGRQLGVTSAFDMTAQPGMETNVTFPLTDSQVGFVSAVTWSITDDNMQVSTRGLIQTPSTAWYFQPTGKPWGSVPTGVSWATGL